jgi:hypothetical protein
MLVWWHHDGHTIPNDVLGVGLGLGGLLLTLPPSVDAVLGVGLGLGLVPILPIWSLA